MVSATKDCMCPPASTTHPRNSGHAFFKALQDRSDAFERAIYYADVVGGTHCNFSPVTSVKTRFFSKWSGGLTEGKDFLWLGKIGGATCNAMERYILKWRRGIDGSCKEDTISKEEQTRVSTELVSAFIGYMLDGNAGSFNDRVNEMQDAGNIINFPAPGSATNATRSSFSTVNEDLTGRSTADASSSFSWVRRVVEPRGAERAEEREEHYK